MEEFLRLASVGGIGGAGAAAVVMEAITTTGTEGMAEATTTLVIVATVDMGDATMDTECTSSSITLAAIPENIQVIRRFPKPHGNLFKLAENVPYWWQLANAAPTLAFMLAKKMKQNWERYISTTTSGSLDLQMKENPKLT